jgi:hypothetical protein
MGRKTFLIAALLITYPATLYAQYRLSIYIEKVPVNPANPDIF